MRAMTSTNARRKRSPKWLLVDLWTMRAGEGVPEDLRETEAQCPGTWQTICDHAIRHCREVAMREDREGW